MTSIRASIYNAKLINHPILSCLRQSQSTCVKFNQNTCSKYDSLFKRYSTFDEKRERREEYVLKYDEFKKAIEEDKIYLIDVREQSEVDDGRVPAKRYVNISVKNILSALQLSAEEFQEKFGISKPNLDEQVVFMCRSGVRSTIALHIGHECGFKNSKHFLGGWLEWSEKYLGVK